MPNGRSDSGMSVAPAIPLRNITWFSRETGRCCDGNYGSGRRTVIENRLVVEASRWEFRVPPQSVFACIATVLAFSGALAK